MLQVPRLCYLLVRWDQFRTVFSSGQHSYNVTTLVAAMSHVLLTSLAEWAVDGPSKVKYFARCLRALFQFPDEEAIANKAALQLRRDCGIDLRMV